MENHFEQMRRSAPRGRSAGGREIGGRRLHVLVSGALFAFAATAVCGCSTTLTLRPDNQWHNVYSVQVPDTILRFKAIRVSSRDSDCRSQTAGATSLRIIYADPFLDYATLPEHLDAAPNPAIPLQNSDSGPLEMSLEGSTRLLSLGTRNSLLVRTDDPCARLQLRKLHP